MFVTCSVEFVHFIERDAVRDGENWRFFEQKSIYTFSSSLLFFLSLFRTTILLIKSATLLKRIYLYKKSITVVSCSVFRYGYQLISYFRSSISSIFLFLFLANKLNKYLSSQI